MGQISWRWRRWIEKVLLIGLRLQSLLRPVIYQRGGHKTTTTSTNEYNKCFPNHTSHLLVSRNYYYQKCVWGSGSWGISRRRSVYINNSNVGCHTVRVIFSWRQGSPWWWTNRWWWLQLFTWPMIRYSGIINNRSSGFWWRRIMKMMMVTEYFHS